MTQAAGTGIICHRFKGDTGSRRRAIQAFDVSEQSVSYMVEVLVQTNYELRIIYIWRGFQLGKYSRHRRQGISTDLPLLPILVLLYVLPSDQARLVGTLSMDLVTSFWPSRLVVIFLLTPIPCQMVTRHIFTIEPRSFFGAR